MSRNTRLDFPPLEPCGGAQQIHKSYNCNISPASSNVAEKNRIRKVLTDHDGDFCSYNMDKLLKNLQKCFCKTWVNATAAILAKLQIAQESWTEDRA